MDFEIIDQIHDIETIAVNTSIRDLDRLKKLRLAELHWYEAHGRGRRDMRRKRYLD